MVDDSMDYDDVSEDLWYTEAIRWATATGIVTVMATENSDRTTQSLVSSLRPCSGGIMNAKAVRGALTMI